MIRLPLRDKQKRSSNFLMMAPLVQLDSCVRHILSRVVCLVHVHLSLVMRKPAFCICENKDADQLRGTAKLISAFVFAIQIVQSLFFLNPKFLASSHPLWLYSPVCVGPGRKLECWFSQDAAHMYIDPSSLSFCVISAKFWSFLTHPESGNWWGF